jgi:hypothetical protein
MYSVIQLRYSLTKIQWAFTLTRNTKGRRLPVPAFLLYCLTFRNESEHTCIYIMT